MKSSFKFGLVFVIVFCGIGIYKTIDPVPRFENVIEIALPGARPARLFKQINFTLPPTRVPPLNHVAQKLAEQVRKLQEQNKQQQLLPSNAQTQNKKSTQWTEKYNIKYNFKEKYPIFRTCKQQNFENRSPKLANSNSALKVSHLQENYLHAANNHTHRLKIVRGVIVYFPMDKAADFQYEFKWLYRSWLEMFKYEPKKWRTDLVVFIDKSHKDFSAKCRQFFTPLNCSFENRRTTSEDLPRCTLIDFKPINDRKLKSTAEYFAGIRDRNSHMLTKLDMYTPNSEELNPFYAFIKESLATYHYADSILMAMDGYEYFKSAGFDFLVRSDMDVFLTPMFATWLPTRCNDFYVGGGGYSNTFNDHRLERIASDIGFEYVGARNLGSTWYSTPHQFRQVAYLTLFSMAYIGTEEFTGPERRGKVGTINWPEWHYGVLLLYGQNLALNHLIGVEQADVIKIDKILDYPSANTKSIFEVLHIHVFHGENMFSKFMFKSGKYDKMNVPKNDTTLIKNFALKMALEGKRTKSEMLARQLDTEGKKKV